VISHLEGTLTVKFDGPTNIPPHCHHKENVEYTESYDGSTMYLQSDGHRAIVYIVTAVPTTSGAAAITATVHATIGTLVGLDPSTGYNVHVRAYNAVGTGPASTIVPDVVPMPIGGSARAQSWSSIRCFVAGLTVEAPTNATFKLRSPQEDPSAVYDGQMRIMGRSNLVIYGDGAVVDANKTGRFFHLGGSKLHGGSGSLTLYNLTLRNGVSGPPGSNSRGGAFFASNMLFIALYFCTLEFNHADGDGGVIYAEDFVGLITFVGCTFFKNTCDRRRRGVCVQYPTLHVA
jgi:hypothetical protein